MPKNPSAINRLLLVEEKTAELSLDDPNRKTLELILTNKYSQLLYNNPDAQGETLYGEINYLVKIFGAFSGRLTSDHKNITQVREFTSYLLKQGGGLQFSESLKNEEVLLQFCNVVFGIFMKENWVGPSYLFENCEKKYARHQVKASDPEYPARIAKKLEMNISESLVGKSEPLLQILGVTQQQCLEFNYKTLKSPEFVNSRHPDIFEDLFMIDGEDCYKTMRFVNLYQILREMLETITGNDSAKACQSYGYANLLLARVYFYHSQIMNHATMTLFNNQTGAYAAAEETFIGNEENLSSEWWATFYLELSHALLHYNKYDDCYNNIQKAKDLLEVNFNWTGKLGVRTKYQQDKVAQLTIIIDKKGEVLLNRKPVQTEPLASNMSKKKTAAVVDTNPTIPTEEIKPKNVPLEDVWDNILYEEPQQEVDPENMATEKISDATAGDSYAQITVHEHMLILALIRHLQKTTPIEDFQREQILCYCNKNLEQFKNWAVYSQTLLIRSQIEIKHYKKLERSLLQLQQLIDDYNTLECSMEERIKYIHGLNYPSFIELQMIMAENYSECGCFMSACQIYERLGMVEEAVECYSVSGHQSQALELANKQLEKKSTPKLQCTLGDITKDLTYYKKAWKASNKRYARAQRSLARQYYNKGDMEKSKKAFEKSLAVNEYQATCWFTLGFVYMRLNTLDKAITAFAKCVQLDETQSLAWANLSGIFMKQGKMHEAFTTISQAAQRRERDAKIWYNFMMVSFQAQKYPSFIKSINTQLDLHQKTIIEAFITSKITIVCKMYLETLKLDHAQCRATELIFSKIEKLFIRMGNEMPERHFIWKNFADYQDIKVQLYYLKKHIQNQVEADPEHPKIYFIEKPDQEKEEYRKEMTIKTYQTLEKNCQAIMIIGWENIIENNELLQEATGRMQNCFRQLQKDAYEKVPDLSTKLNIHLNSIRPTIKRTLDGTGKYDESLLTL